MTPTPEQRRRALAEIVLSGHGEPIVDHVALIDDGEVIRYEATG